jgi:hypothetical protein
MAVRHRVATEEEVDRLVDELYQLTRDPHTLMATPRIVQVWGEKP